MMHAFDKIRQTLARFFGNSGKKPHKQASLAYRQNQEAIRQGKIPDKYTRVLDVVPGDRVLELGAAEGVLSLLLAEHKSKVYGLEMKKERHAEALRLQALWREQGRNVDNCEMVLGDIRERLNLLDDVDTLVAVRSIYYLRDQVEPIFAEIGKHVPNIVLCGNRVRSHRYFEANGQPDDNLGKYNFYASLEGMTDVLQKAGYTVVKTIPQGDPIVVGKKDIL